VVSTFNAGYTARTGKDANNPAVTVTRGERIQAIGATAALLPTVGIVRGAGAGGLRIAEGVSQMIQSAKEGDVFLGVIENGSIRLFKTGAEIEGHSDLLNLGLISQNAQGFSVWVLNGKFHMLPLSCLNSAENNNILQQQIIQILMRIFKIPAANIVLPTSP